ncbi:MAG: hypothetical protein WC494_00835 [Candidatus Pacearchaeota archaeon]
MKTSVNFALIGLLAAIVTLFLGGDGAVNSEEAEFVKGIFILFAFFLSIILLFLPTREEVVREFFEILREEGRGKKIKYGRLYTPRALEKVKEVVSLAAKREDFTLLIPLLNGLGESEEVLARVWEAVVEEKKRGMMGYLLERYPFLLNLHFFNMGTASHFLAREKEWELLAFLKEQGANFNEMDYIGVSVYDLIRESPLSRLFLEKGEPSEESPQQEAQEEPATSDA